MQTFCGIHLNRQNVQNQHIYLSDAGGMGVYNRVGGCNNLGLGNEITTFLDYKFNDI